MLKTLKNLSLISILPAILLFCVPIAVVAQSKQQEILDKSVDVLTEFSEDDDGRFFKQTLKKAKAVLIVPVMFKGGMIFGGSTGDGALLFHNDEKDKWSYPAFYTISSISFGLLAGLETSQLILAVMTSKGVEALQEPSFQLGFDITAAAGPYGAGAKAATADILAYAKSKGIYGGIALEGAKIAVLTEWNRKYYRKVLSPADFISNDSFSNSAAEPLREILQSITRH